MLRSQRSERPALAATMHGSSELRLPDLDLPGLTAAVCSWHAAVGQRVVEGDRLLEIVAGDVAIDLPAPITGTLVERCAEIDQPLSADQVLARIQPD
jgi:pyruvate/2-oxoglutarate dehydrogenase complex dihydrolipoamide acyltransferase (E2) component